MPHSTNIRAFRDADIGVPLFRLYTLLVAIELHLKDLANSNRNTHDFDLLVNDLFPAGIPPLLQGTLTNLQNILSSLHCTNRGSSSPVNPAMYPGLRYVRLQMDGFADPGTPAADISNALQAANDFRTELKNVGILL